MIYHLVWKSDWDSRVRDGLYRADSLVSEGFIHCTREAEVLLEVAEQFFPKPPPEPLLLLAIDSSKLSAEIRDEDPGCGRLFPHVYGPMETAAVVRIDEMGFEEGRWRLPSAIV